MRLTKRLFFWAGLICLASLFLIFSCGKKGPVLPSIKAGNVLAAPENIAYILEGNQVILSWTHAIDPINARLQPQSFKVFSATKNADACQGCPFVFKIAGLVPMPAMVYRQNLPLGPRYYFRVQAIGENDIKSGYSKTISIDFEK